MDYRDFIRTEKLLRAIKSIRETRRRNISKEKKEEIFDNIVRRLNNEEK